MCAACTGSAVTGRDVCTGHLVRICVRLSVHGRCVCVVVPFIHYMSPLKSTSTARMPPWPNVYGSAPR